MLIKELLEWGTETLSRSSSSSPRLDAEVLLAHVLKKEATFLLTHDNNHVSFWPLHRYKKLILKRKSGVPVAYITGHKEFYFLDFKVSKHVLIPRPDTELLVEEVVRAIKEDYKNKKVTLVDIGTGSGCIPIAVLSQCKKVRGIGIDISKKALKIAKFNAKKHGVSSRIEFIQSNLLEKVDLKPKKDEIIILTANLPYIPRQFELHPSTDYEPDVALYGGDDGMDLYKELLKELKTLKPDMAAFELFEFQVEKLERHLADYKVVGQISATGQARIILLK